MTRLISRITLVAIFAVGPFPWLNSIYRTALNASHVPLEFAEEYVAQPIIVAELFVDNKLGKPDQTAAAIKAARKAAKKAAKAQKAAPAVYTPNRTH